MSASPVNAALELLLINIRGAIASAVDNPSKADLIAHNAPNWPGMVALRAALDGSETRIQERTFSQRVVLHRNGDPIHFEVTCNFQRIAEMIGSRAEATRTHKATLAERAVTVEHLP